MAPFIATVGGVAVLVFTGACFWTQRTSLTANSLTRLYLYVAAFISSIVLALGVSILLTGLFALPSPDFSYAIPALHTNTPVQAPQPAVNIPGADEQTQQRVRQQQEQLAAQEKQRAALTDHLKLRDEQDRQSEKRINDILHGATLAVLGGFFLVLHLMLRRRLSPDQQFDRVCNIGWAAASLFTFGISGLIELPAGVFQAVQFAVVNTLPIDTRVAPGSDLAEAIAFTPVWIYFLVTLLRRARASHDGSPAWEPVA